MYERSFLAKRLKAFMGEHHIMQKELAELLHVQPGSVNRYLMEYQVPHPEIMCRICELLEEPAESILGLHTITEPCSWQALRSVVRDNRDALTQEQRELLARILLEEGAQPKVRRNSPAFFRWAGAGPKKDDPT